MKWLRLYTELVNDDKVQRLSGEAFKFWVNLLCIASTADASGALPEAKTLSFLLRSRLHRTRKMLEILHTAGLLEEVDGAYSIHKWADRQPRSDSSAERMRASRERHSDDGVTPQIRREKKRTDKKRGEESVTASQRRHAEPPAAAVARHEFLEAPENERVKRLVELGDALGFPRNGGRAAHFATKFDRSRVLDAATEAFSKARGDPWNYMEGVLKNDRSGQARGGAARGKPGGSTTPVEEARARW